MTATAPARVDNATDPRRVHCDYCCNEGMVPVALRPTPKVVTMHQGRPVFHATENMGGADWQEYASEEYGPCPACTLGERVEAQRWPHGFWKGKAWWTVLARSCRCSDSPAPPPADFQERIRSWSLPAVDSSTPGDNPVGEGSWAE